MARRPIWLWPNLLSLDAPLVALAWFWMFKQTWRVGYHQALLPWFLALLVWCIYVADRLIDERMAAMGSQRKTPRHEFHASFRLPFTIALLAGGLLAVGLLLLQPPDLWKHGAFVGVLALGYFTMAFLDSGTGISYTKNVLAGLAFGYGTAVGVHFYRPDSNLGNFVGSPEVLCFGLLCILNITAIDHWEQARRSEDPDVRDDYEMVLTLLLLVLVAGSFFLGLRADEFREPFFFSVALAAGALQLLNRARSRLSLDALRVLADVAMILPLPFFYLWVDFAERF